MTTAKSTKRNLAKEIQSGLDALKEEHQGKRYLKRATQLADTTKKAIKEVQQMSKPAKALIGQAVVMSVAQLMKKQMTSFVFTNKKVTVLLDGITGYVINKKKRVAGPGVIVFKENSTGKLSVSTTVSLPLFFEGLTLGKMRSGKYGAGPKAMALGEIEVYYEEYPTEKEARKVADKLRTKIKKEGLNKV